MTFRVFVLVAVLIPTSLFSQTSSSQASLSQAAVQTISGWQMQYSAKVTAAAPQLSSTGFRPEGWYAAIVPGTVLTTLVNNKVYPEPLYGENMRAIPESLNKTSYWYRTTLQRAGGIQRTARVASLRRDQLQR